MLNLLHHTFENLLKKEAPELFDDQKKEKSVEIKFDVPSREWSGSLAKPTVNFHLYDVRENRELRAPGWHWDKENRFERDGKSVVPLSPNPVRMSLSYMVTCWAKESEEQHRIFWRVLETLYRQSPLGEKYLDEGLKKSLEQMGYKGRCLRVPTEVAQPDGVLRNVSEFWGALDNQIRPAVSLVAELPLALGSLPEKVAVERVIVDLPPGSFVHVQVKDAGGQPVSKAVLSLTSTGSSESLKWTALDPANGHYAFERVPAGIYTLRAEAEGRKYEGAVTVPPEPLAGNPLEPKSRLVSATVR